MSDNTLVWPWSVLDISETAADKRVIKRAYARKLKQIDQATDLNEFQDLRQAYKTALSLCQISQQSAPSPTPAPMSPVPADLAMPSAPLPDVDPPELSEPPAVEYWLVDTPLPPEEATPNDPVDWSRVDALCAEISSNSMVESKAEQLRRNFADPVFEDIAAKEVLERSVYNFVKGALVQDTEWPHFWPVITNEVLHLVDDHFAWNSDYISFRKRFGDSHNLVFAMSQKLYKARAVSDLKTPVGISAKIIRGFGSIRIMALLLVGLRIIRPIVEAVGLPGLLGAVQFLSFIVSVRLVHLVFYHFLRKK